MQKNTFFRHKRQGLISWLLRIRERWCERLCRKRFVLINADLGAEEDLLKKLKAIPNVEDVYVVYGVYDIVARVKADTMEKVKETITWSIRRLDKVRSTLTMIVVEGE